MLQVIHAVRYVPPLTRIIIPSSVRTIKWASDQSACAYLFNSTQFSYFQHNKQNSLISEGRLTKSQNTGCRRSHFRLLADVNSAK